MQVAMSSAAPGSWRPCPGASTLLTHAGLPAAVQLPAVMMPSKPQQSQLRIDDALAIACAQERTHSAISQEAPLT